MDRLSFTIGIFGIISGLIVSLFGLYFNYKERIANHRIELFKIQFDLLIEILNKLNEVENAAESYRFDYKSEKKLESNQELFNCYKSFRETSYKASVILPTEIFTSLVRLGESIKNLLSTLWEKDQSIETLYDNFIERSIALKKVSRALFGINSISNNNYKLFSKPNFEYVYAQLLNDYKHLKKKPKKNYFPD